MAEAYKHTGPITAREVVDLWTAWCVKNELPPPVFDLLEGGDDEVIEAALEKV